MRFQSAIVWSTIVGLVGLATACHDLTGDPGLPAGTPNPNSYNTKIGAIGLRNTALSNAGTAITYAVFETGLLTDELEDVQARANVGTIPPTQNGGSVLDPLDERILLEGGAAGFDGRNSYGPLQTLRGSANLAQHALAAYDTAPADSLTQRAMRGELFALQGYAEILLADLFCAGVPLSTIDFQHDFTYAASSTTAQVYQDALAKLDSARRVAPASDSVTNLSRVLQGRAYLALGQYDSAAAAVANIPVGFQYVIAAPLERLTNYGSVSELEGRNGLPYRSSNDPRVAPSVICTPPGINCPSDTVWMPAKYDTSHTPPYVLFPLASGIEAQLIIAENQLRTQLLAPLGTGTTWLTTLNQLRATVQLPDTTDPGTPDGRIALLMRERAFWLFMTGHRQGDLRRLLRQYSQYASFSDQSRVYPTGPYTAPGTGFYGIHVNAPIPTTEYANPAYHGCLNRNP